MRLALTRTTSTTASATITIINDPRDVVLDGITVHQPRPGWVTIDLPGEEQWTDALRWLRPEQRERLQTAEFYTRLQRLLTERFLAAPPP